MEKKQDKLLDSMYDRLFEMVTTQPDNADNPF